MKFIEKVKKLQSGGSASNDTWMFKPDEARAAGIVSGSNSHNFLTPNYPEHVEDFDPEKHGYLDSIDASTSTFKYPDLNTSEGRKYATKMALRTASGEMPYENVPYQYRTFVGALQNGWKTSSAMNDFGKKFTPVLAGSFLAGPAMTYGITAYSNPLVRTTLDAIGSIDGIRNAFTDNGISKTIRLAKEGDTWGAVKSGVGDVFDIASIGDLIKTGKPLFNTLKKGLNTTLFDAGDVIAKVKHPTWQRYYHGSPEPFDIKNFYKGTSADLGLHVSDRRKIAERFAHDRFKKAINPTVYKFYAPKPTMEVMDLHSNGLDLFAGNRTWLGVNSIYDATPDSKLLFNTLKKYGGDDVIDFIPKTKLDYEFGNIQTPFRLKRNVTVPIEQVHWPNRSAKVNQKIQELKKQYTMFNEEDLTLNNPQFTDAEMEELRAKLNAQMADILAENGHPVLKYANNVNGEGGGFSYIITDPTKMYIPPTIPIKTWHVTPIVGATAATLTNDDK